MFYVNDDDTDGLFRKAAENYDINAEQASDFNAVLKALNEEGGRPEPEPEKKKRRFLAFWWLLLLPLAGLLLLWNNQQTDLQNNAASKENMRSDSVAGIVQEHDVAQDNAAARVQNEKGTETQKSKSSNAQRTENSPLEVIQQVNRKNEKIQEIQNQRVPEQDVFDSKLPADDIKKKDARKQDEQVIVADETVPGKDEVSTAKPANPDANNNVNIAQQLPVETVDDRQKNKNTNKPKNSFFYAGLSGAVDISFVKFQETSSPGISAGIIAGYRINKNWQLEAGILFDKKNYYTAGQYFDKSNVPYLNWVDLKSVSGSCNMLEIPLNVRFNFGEKKKHTWFASTGVSSYLMTKEYYHYHYMENGSYNQSEHTYDKSSKDWFSIMNLSAGYELKTGAKTFIRFEPYYKLPLKGVGTGNLPLSSAGLNIAITRQIP